MNLTKGINLTKLSKTELFTKCEELGITKCKSKNKEQLIELINKKTLNPPQIEFIIEEGEYTNEEAKPQIEFMIEEENENNIVTQFLIDTIP